MKETHSKNFASWANSRHTLTAYGEGKYYGADQIYEYVTLTNQNYGEITTWDDSTKKNYGESLLSNLRSANYNRQENWEVLKNDGLIGSIAELTLESQITVANSFIEMNTSLETAKQQLQFAIDKGYDFLHQNTQYKQDFLNTIAAYEATNRHIVNNKDVSLIKVVDVFEQNLNGTTTNSYGSMLAAIMLSLGSTKNIINNYESHISN